LNDQFQRGDLVEPWPQIRVPGPTFHVIWRTSTPRQSEIEIFVAWLAEMTKKEPQLPVVTRAQLQAAL